LEKHKGCGIKVSDLIKRPEGEGPSGMDVDEAEAPV